MSAIHQFVGWKYVGVVVRELVAVVQHRVLPWDAGNGVDGSSVVPPNRKVTTLLIGDEFFADKDGFGHRVPLPPDRVRQLLVAVVQAAPQARVVIDFDLAPRVGEPVEPRAGLDDWLAHNAHRLLLVEPSWAARHAETLGRQLDWAWRMCKVGPYREDTNVPGAEFVQSTLVSRFGVVVDSLPLSGEHGPAWDIGRAVADPAAAPDGRRRNPLCDRLEGEAGTGTACPQQACAAPPAPDPLVLQLQLGEELQRHGALRVDAQPADSKGHGDRVQLRSEYIHADKACEPKGFDDIASLACMRDADVVVVGGSWSYGFGDKQDTFVGEVDGALVHAAWIRSWLRPARHLNKLLDIVLDVVVIESLLHPILEYAFVGMRRRSDIYLRRMKFDAPHKGLGQHVTWMVIYVALAVVAFAGTALALIVADGLLRRAFDRTLSLDTTILALVIWSAIALNGIGARSHKAGQSHREFFPRRNAIWLVTLCAVNLGTVYAVTHWAVAVPAAVPALVFIALAGVPAGFVAHAMLGHMRSPEVGSENISDRWHAFWKRLRVLWGSIGLSLRLVGAQRAAATDGWLARLADACGALLWLGLWGYGLWVLASSTLWGLLVEMLKG